MVGKEGIVCSECGRPPKDWLHADTNPRGHFFSTERHDLSPRIAIAKRERPSRGKPDYKWWVRSYAKQVMIRDMAAEKIRQHFAGGIILEDGDREELEGIVRELSKQIDRRKRITLERIPRLPDLRISVVVRRRHCAPVGQLELPWRKSEGRD